MPRLLASWQRRWYAAEDAPPVSSFVREYDDDEVDAWRRFDIERDASFRAGFYAPPHGYDDWWNRYGPTSERTVLLLVDILRTPLGQS